MPAPVSVLVPVAALLGLPGASLPNQARIHAPPPLGGERSQPLAWGDFDGDGRLDALSVSAAGRLQLHASRAEAGFEDVTDVAGLAGIDAVTVALWGDYDGDGRMDLFVGRGAGASLLLRNEGGSFVDMATGAGLVIEEPVRGAHWLDEDGDRRLDLHVVTDGSSRIWRGLAGGFFEPVELPLASPATPVAGGAGSLPVATDAGGRAPTATPFAGASADVDRGGVAHASGVSTQPVIGPPPLTGVATPIAFSGCALSITDQANPGTCLEASSAAVLGRLYPLSSKLFVDETTGRVGIGTTTPAQRLHVVGQIQAGIDCVVTNFGSTVSGGHLNQVLNSYANVGGGFDNVVTGHSATIGGGYENDASGDWATVGGGSSCLASGIHATVGGGTGNEASGNSSTIGGGWVNQGTGTYATIGGGRENVADLYGTVGGGHLNQATGFKATVGGGGGNLALGNSSTIPGGSACEASESFSFASGYRAKARHRGSFVWGDSQGDVGNIEKPSSAEDEFNVYSEGGVRIFAEGIAAPSMVVDSAGSVGIGTAAPQVPLHVEGGIRSAGASGGQFTTFNPNNQNASAHFSWLNDVARFRVGGSGAGANGGFDFQRIGDQSLLRLLDNGNVGIGTTTPAFDLEVNGTAAKPGGGSWSVSSDARLKKDVEDLEGALATLLALRGVTFEYIDPAALGELEGRRIGFLAQEVERVLPDWVGEREDGTKFLTIRGFEALAVEALRELERESAAKDARLAALEERLARLEQVQAQLEVRSARSGAPQR